MQSVMISYRHGSRLELKKRTARGLQYSGPVITLRAQYGLQRQYNTMELKKCRIPAQCPQVTNSLSESLTDRPRWTVR